MSLEDEVPFELLRDRYADSDDDDEEQTSAAVPLEKPLNLQNILEGTDDSQPVDEDNEYVEEEEEDSDDDLAAALEWADMRDGEPRTLVAGC